MLHNNIDTTHKEGAIMADMPCTYPWRDMYPGYPPECYWRMRLTAEGEPDCAWCAYGGGESKKIPRK